MTYFIAIKVLTSKKINNIEKQKKLRASLVKYFLSNKINKRS